MVVTIAEIANIVEIAIADIAQIVTVMVCPIAPIATAMATAFPIGRTDGRTTLAAIDQSSVTAAPRNEYRSLRSGSPH
jgi:hypothetical protein